MNVGPAHIVLSWFQVPYFGNLTDFIAPWSIPIKKLPDALQLVAYWI
jgi:hypothetical protein